MLLLLVTLTIIRNRSHLFRGWSLVEYHTRCSEGRSLIICPMFALCSVMVCVGGIEVDQLRVCVCGHIRLVWTKHATAGQVHTVWWVFGTSASITGVLRYWGITGGYRGMRWEAHRGWGGESSASCINYTGKKPPRTHKNYQL